VSPAKGFLEPRTTNVKDQYVVLDAAVTLQQSSCARGSGVI
jgi:hypothetical protein